MKDNNIRIVFMGTPEFAVPILKGLIENYKVELVVCQPDRKKNRKGNLIIPDTKKIAIENNIEVFQPERIKDNFQKIINLKPDIIVTCAYGQIIPKELIDSPKYGSINVHGSLLPKLRGGAPIHWAIINGESETGMTVMKMSTKMDAGDIISQRKITIDQNENLSSLYKRMSLLGRELLLETIPKIIDGTATYKKQNEEEVTYGYNITKEQEKIDWSKSKEDIHNLIRGLSPIPGAYCYLDNQRLKILKSLPEKSNQELNQYQNGEIVKLEKESIIVKCQTGYIKILEIQLEGKKQCLVKDFLNGANSKKLIGKVLK